MGPTWVEALKAAINRLEWRQCVDRSGLPEIPICEFLGIYGLWNSWQEFPGIFKDFPRITFLWNLIVRYYVKPVFFEVRYGEQHWTVISCSTFWIHGTIEWLISTRVTNSNLFSITKPTTHGPTSMADTNDWHCRLTDTVDWHFDCWHWQPTKLQATASE